MNRRAVALTILGFGFLILAAEMFLGMLHGSDMCWLGTSGEPFDGPPCPKNYIADPLRMFFAYLSIHLSDFTAVNTWGVPFFVAIMLGTFIVSMAFFGLALQELSSSSRSKVMIVILIVLVVVALAVVALVTVGGTLRPTSTMTTTITTTTVTV